jgi:acetyl esterase/lipase
MIMLRSLLVLCCLPALTLAQEKAAVKLIEVEKKLNLTYNDGDKADPVRHKLDLYLPKGTSNAPMLMFVHGGTWKSGNKDLYAAMGEQFAQHGIAMAIINYRLTRENNEVKHPDHIQDVAKAFAWVKENAGKYGWSKERLYVCGHSAGGHLVALLATNDAYLKAEKCAVKDIRGVLALSGVYEILPIIPIFHRPFSNKSDICKEASPVTHVKEGLPPFLVAYADRDLPGLEQMAKAFGEKLKSSKDDVEIMKLSNRDHISIMLQLATKADDPLAKAVREFVEKK